jgi:Protein phosphatase 2C
MTADAPQLSPRGTQGVWLALTASQLGAAHLAAGLPNQDAVATVQVNQDVLVAAVADGHGHRRHFRSARGSEFAVAAACEAAQEFAARLDRFETAEQIQAEALHKLVPAITRQWRDAVGDDLAAEPFTREEQAGRAASDDALIAYGSTLLLAIAGRKWLVLAQIGDGDIVGIQPDGRPLLPVPGDPSLDGQQTTSLCEPRAEQEFRAAVVNITATALLGVLLATDGYGNAQVADPWADAVSADLARLISDRSPEWLASQLPSWATRCASADGSADDTTIALLIAPSAAGRRQEAPTVPTAVDVPATAARRLAEPASVGDPDSPRPASAGQRGRLMLITGLVLVVIAAAAAFLVSRLLDHSAAGSAACPPSSTTGTPVTGKASAITMCDPGSGHDVQVSLAGLPAGERVVLQAGRSAFVLVDDTLWSKQITGTDQGWVKLGKLPASAHQALCRSTPSAVVADASAAASWEQVRVSAAFPRPVASPSSVTSNVCASGLSR